MKNVSDLPPTDVLVLRPDGIYTDKQLKAYLGVGATAWGHMKERYGIEYRKIGIRKVLLGEDLIKMLKKPVKNTQMAERFKRFHRRKKIKAAAAAGEGTDAERELLDKIAARQETPGADE